MACTTLAAWRGGGHLSAEPAAGWGAAITMIGAPDLRTSVQSHFHKNNQIRAGALIRGSNAHADGTQYAVC